MRVPANQNIISDEVSFPPPPHTAVPEPNKTSLLFPSIKLSKMLAVLYILNILQSFIGRVPSVIEWKRIAIE